MKADAGVILKRVEALTEDNMVTSAHLTLTTTLHDETRVFSDVKRATTAFKAEVKAALNGREVGG